VVLFPDIKREELMTQVGIPEAHVRHREDFQRFVLEDSLPSHRVPLTRLYEHWNDANEQYFDSVLVPPHVLLSEPSTPSALGDCSPVSGWGSRSQIRIRPSLLAGTHRAVVPGEVHAEGRMRFVLDVLLHETLHQHAMEVSRRLDEGYHGHGPAFRDNANRIGALLGLEPVRTSKARGKDRKLESCAHWPHCVRPKDFYLGALCPGGELDEERILATPAPPNALYQAQLALLEAARCYGSGGNAEDGARAARLLEAARVYARAVPQSTD
jgi:hypothetical protein